MGITKTDLFNDDQNVLANYAKALAHPARIAIIQHLLKAKDCVNGDLVQEIGLAQATISQHLRELKDIGIIQGSIEGSRVSYCINSNRWSDFTHAFSQMFAQYEAPCGDDCC